MQQGKGWNHKKTLAGVGFSVIQTEAEIKHTNAYNTQVKLWHTITDIIRNELKTTSYRNLAKLKQQNWIKKQNNS